MNNHQANTTVAGARRALWRHLLGALVMVASVVVLVAPAGAETLDVVEPVDVVPMAADTGDTAPGGGSFTAANVGPGSVTIQGRGWGHGRGLGQYGSLGYALDGWSSARILDHFYGGTTAASIDSQTVLVHLTANNGSATDGKVFRSVSSAVDVAGVIVAAGTYARVSWDGAIPQIQTSGACTGPWEEGRPIPPSRGDRPNSSNDYGYVEAVPVDISADDPDTMLTLCEWSGSTLIGTTTYRGSLVLARDDGGSNTTWVGNRVDLESYVRGVVPYESPASWGSLGGGRGMAALEAQAVAARSYAVALAVNRRSRGFATAACDTTACQVYRGVDGETRNSDTAVANTRGIVRKWPSGAVALTEFSSSTGGYTSTLAEGNPFGPVPDLGDAVSANPNHFWTTSLAASSIESRYPQIGDFESIRVTRRNGLGTWGGRTNEIRIEGDGGVATVDVPNWDRDQFRRAFGLKSNWYEFPGQTATGEGFWAVKPDGSVAAFGDASFHGDASTLVLNSPIVDMEPHPSGLGYWLLGEDGGIFSYGTAPFFGSTGGIDLNQPVVAMAAHPSGDGYWFVAADGGVFAYGNAAFHGSMGGIDLVSPVVGMAPTATGDGYWLVAADGGMFAFGDARFFGSIGGRELDDEVVGMASHPDGGYWIVDEAGQVTAFGAASLQGQQVRRPASPVVGIAAPADGSGYWLIRSDGLSYSRGVTDYPSSSFGGPVVGIASLP